MIAFYILSTLTILLVTPLFHYKTLLVYQLCGYRLSETIVCFKRKSKNGLIIYLLVTTILSLTTFLTYYLKKNLLLVTLPLIIIAGVLSAIISHKRAKVKLKLTKRVQRFITLFSVLSALVSFPVVLLYPPLLVFYIAIFSLVALVLSHLILTPLEKRRNGAFIDRAKSVLMRENLLKIGITGSYGKTTAKNILYAFLSEKYAVCKTKGNYNTPLGIALSVNNDLTEQGEIFIAEMGARYKGDIAELCDIVRPKVGVITAIGTQHLDTFKSEENLLDTKGELIDALPVGGIGVFNGDDDGSRKLYDRCKSERIIIGRDERGIKSLKNGKRHKSEFDLFYGNASYSEKGCNFTLSNGKTVVEITTKLLGEHIPQSITLCAAVAFRLGVPFEKIKIAAEGLKAVAHRLELLYNGSDIIIDDAYNGSEQSVKSALKTLKLFTPRVRIAITPGVVELGARQEQANELIGEIASECCDYLLAVGVNSQSIKKGALKGKMSLDKVYACASLAEATEKLKEIKGERAILFASDLPDNY